MALIIIGIIILIVSTFIRAVPNLSSMGVLVRYIALGVIVLGIITSCFIQIDAGEVGVTKLFGKVQPNVLSSGLHFINPLYQVERLDVRTKNYTMSGVSDEGRRTGDDAIRVLTADGLEVTIDLSVLYHVLPSEAPRLIRETGNDYEDKIVRPISRTKIRDNAVYYDAVALYSTKRDEFQGRIFKTIDDEYKRRGLLLENLLVRYITLPAAVKSSIEQKIQAEQESQKMEFVLAKERQEAERKRVEAQGISDYQRVISESLTDKQLQYEQIKAMKELAQSQNAKLIMMGGKGAPVILDTKQ
jgi:regulator of protease activity HflC (stomatin/prohibitin superfamily)